MLGKFSLSRLVYIMALAAGIAYMTNIHFIKTGVGDRIIHGFVESHEAFYLGKWSEVETNPNEGSPEALGCVAGIFMILVELVFGACLINHIWHLTKFNE